MMENAEAIWAAKSDDELLEAAGELFEYTESGEQIIRAELRRRGLAEPDPPIGKCSRCGRSIPSNHPGDQCSECEEPFAPDILRKLGAGTPDPVLVPVLRTEDPGVVPLAKSILDEEGIEHLVRGEDLQDPFGAHAGGGGYGRGRVEFCVREEDAERARTLLDGLNDAEPQPGGTPGAFQSSSDVIIRTASWDDAAAFYTSVLGFPVVHRGDGLIGVRTGAFTLYIERGTDSHGPVFEYLVADVASAKRTLVAAGCTVVEENPSVPRCYLRDPYGVVFNIGSKE